MAMFRPHPPLFAQFVFALALASSPALAAESDDVPPDITRARAEAKAAFKDQVSPFLKDYCGRCHTGNHQRGGVTFESIFKDPKGIARPTD